MRLTCPLLLGLAASAAVQPTGTAGTQTGMNSPSVSGISGTAPGGCGTFLAGFLQPALLGQLPDIVDGSPGQTGPDTAAPPLVTGLTVSDVPNDAGGVLELTWDQIPVPVASRVVHHLLRSTDGVNWEQIAWIVGTDISYSDIGVVDGQDYYYSMYTFAGRFRSLPVETALSTPSAQWLNSLRAGMLVVMVLLTAVIFWFIDQGRKGRSLYIREIAGLSAVDDAVGRATEMGRSVLYIPGIMGMDDIQTIASMIILGRVAGKTAEYGASLQVPVCNSVVMSVGQEIVKESYLAAGRPDTYRRDNVYYLTDDQFGYAAGVDGIMVRQRPAAIFMLGTFYAESLILAETGKSVGAIQIAGTAMPSQLPFFIAACDYTLIGEELFAASAYLSREPKLLGSLKGQDAAKLIIMILIVLGVVAASTGTWWKPAASLADFLRQVVHVE